MSLRESGSEAAVRRVKASRRPPIDMEHLEKQTLGNRALQKEVLALFQRQSVECVGKIKAATTVADRSEAAHALVGSARGVGAFSIAYIASEIELAKGPVTGRLIALDRAVEAARFFIADLLAA
jgi:HPt (histidine-containing phosphotransfer) domain-containing protein